MIWALVQASDGEEFALEVPDLDFAREIADGFICSDHGQGWVCISQRDDLPDCDWSLTWDEVRSRVAHLMKGMEL